MRTKVEDVKIYHKRKEVTAKKLTVVSTLPIDIRAAWAKVATSELLEYITKGKVKFKPVNGKFPPIWKDGMTVSTRMLLYGFIPFGGVRTIYFEKIDSERHIAQTKEKDTMAKIWNHKIAMTKIDDGLTEYMDEIIIYGGILTSIIVLWAKSFCQYRQKRWLKIAHENA
jgi:hypothetical protein